MDDAMAKALEATKDWGMTDWEAFVLVAPHVRTTIAIALWKAMPRHATCSNLPSKPWGRGASG